MIQTQEENSEEILKNELRIKLHFLDFYLEKPKTEDHIVRLKTN